MRKMSNLEYSFAVQELSDLAGKHFARIRRMGEGIYRMKIGSAEILCHLGVRLHKTKYMEEAGPDDNFVQRVSKELDNAKLLSVEQLNNDRIVSFDFNKGELVFEMFGGGNAVLVQDKKITASCRKEKWADREIKHGVQYAPPSTIPSEKLELSDKYVIVSLVKLPFGKEYALEALARAGIDEKTPGNKLSKEQIAKLEKELGEIRKSAKPYVFMKEGKPADFALAKLSKYSELDIKEAATLGEAADDYFAALEAPSERLEKLERRLEKQKERLGQLKQEEKECRAKGDLIYQHYNEVEEIISSAKESKFKGKINKKEKSVEAELQ